MLDQTSRQVAKLEYNMSDLDSTISTNSKTAAVPGFRMGKDGVRMVLAKELGAGTANVSFIQETYPEMVTLKLARGKKDPERSGTVGYIIGNDGSLEELDNNTKLSEIGWGNHTDSALVICYLSLQTKSYRVYSAKKMQELFGVNEESDSLD